MEQPCKHWLFTDFVSDLHHLDLASKSNHRVLCNPIHHLVEMVSLAYLHHPHSVVLVALVVVALVDHLA
jgi:hypothetical protein